MERYKVTLPAEETIIERKIFEVDKILPICIRYINDNTYVILFFVENESNESLFLQMMINASNEADKEFLNSHILNLENIKKDKSRFGFYIDCTRNATNDNVFASDFDMIEVDNSYNIDAANMVNKVNARFLKVVISRDNFIKINMFFTRFMSYDPLAETVFLNHKLNNIKFAVIDNVKLDGSATNIGSKIVCNHYTCKSGNDIFRFNFISMKFSGRVLKKPISPELYNNYYYNEHFVITDFVYDSHSDCLYIIYEQRSDITDSYKATYALKFTKEFYDKTNIIDLDNIYLNEKENDPDAKKII